MANESYHTRKLRKELERRGLFYKHHGFMTAGISDLIGCVGGKFVAIECKMNNGGITPLQQYFLTHVVENGGAGFIVRFVGKLCTVSEWATGTTETVQSIPEAALWLLNHLCSSTSKTRLI